MEGRRLHSVAKGHATVGGVRHIPMVCERIRREKPETWLATIHNSILCHPRDANYVQSVMEEEFAGIGAKPTIKRNDYGLPS